MKMAVPQWTQVLVGLSCLLGLALPLAAGDSLPPFPGPAPAARSFVVSGNAFVKDGQEFRIVSGSIHYFRSLPEQWPARLRTLRSCGLNTVTTYVPWNLHEPTPGQYDFSGRLDIVRFIEAAQQEGFLVIVRPPPYICAELEFGGLPAWLLNEEGLQLRCSDPKYLKRVDSFLDHFLPMLATYQYSRGGPIIAMQVENEYGSYGNDHLYLRHLELKFRQHQIDAILFSSNGAGDQMFVGGALPSLLRTVNFGTGADVEGNLKVLRKYQPSGPLFVTEFWDGWFDHWGEEHHTTTPTQSMKTLEAILSNNASVNLYMAFGGTNFGFTNGANKGYGETDPYQPTTTSYDYDAPVNESGDATQKCATFRALISRFIGAPPVPIPPPAPKLAYGSLAMTQSAFLFDAAVLQSVTARTVESATTLPMEALHQNFGFVLYSATFDGPLSDKLFVQDLADRALVFVDGAYKGVLQRSATLQLSISAGPGAHKLDLLVENMGRINFGPWLADRKGITEGVRIGSQFLYHWTMRALPFDDLTRVPFGQLSAAPFAGPTFFRGNLHIASAAQLNDTFLELPGWTKGFALINGFNLGRYWKIGPQQSLYVPAPLLRVGDNEVVVFELHGTNNNRAPSVVFTSFARYGRA